MIRDWRVVWVLVQFVFVIVGIVSVAAFTVQALERRFDSPGPIGCDSRLWGDGQIEVICSP